MVSRSQSGKARYPNRLGCTTMGSLLLPRSHHLMTEPQKRLIAHEGREIPMKIAILGTGDVGSNLATKVVELGHEVRMGSRTPEKAKDWAKIVRHREP